MDRADVNFKYIQWNRLDYMADMMRLEVERRCEGKEAICWRNRSAVSIDRMRVRIERALGTVDRPELQ